MRFHANAVDREMTYDIILPSGYRDAANRDLQYPTLYLLHGYGNGYEGWSRFMGIPSYAPRYELIIVMPDAGNSYYVNWAEGDSTDAWEDYITQDVIGHVEANYRAIPQGEARAITGFSMGGYGALTIGLRNPTLFASIGSQSGALEYGRRAATRLRAGDPALAPRQYSPERQAQMNRPNPVFDLPGFSSVTDRTPTGQPFATVTQAEAHDPFSLVLQVPREQLPLIQLDLRYRGQPHRHEQGIREPADEIRGSVRLRATVRWARPCVLGPGVWIRDWLALRSDATGARQASGCPAEPIDLST